MMGLQYFRNINISWNDAGYSRIFKMGKFARMIPHPVMMGL